MTQYLTVAEVLAIHDLLIEEFGGTEGIRDLGALEAAVFRPQTGYYEDAIVEAAALLESLIQNHPFLDGNKPTAVAPADVHLRLNGLELAGDSTEHHRFIIGLSRRGSRLEGHRRLVEAQRRAVLTAIRRPLIGIGPGSLPEG